MLQASVSSHVILMGCNHNYNVLNCQIKEMEKYVNESSFIEPSAVLINIYFLLILQKDAKRWNFSPFTSSWAYMCTGDSIPQPLYLEAWFYQSD